MIQEGKFRQVLYRCEQTHLAIGEIEMLQFDSASTRMVNPVAAVDECIALAESYRPGLGRPSVVIVKASVGHNLLELSKRLRERFPGVRVVGNSCAGIVGREGVSETLRDVAMMFISGEDVAVAKVEDIYGSNAYEKGRDLAVRLGEQISGINMIYLLAPGINIANDRVLAGFESIFGREVTVFGGTSSDNMRGICTNQVVDDEVYEHTAYAVGFADPGLIVDTQATHGFVAIGDPMVVTRAAGNIVMELDGKPAWPVYCSRMSFPPTSPLSDTIPVGALAERLSPELAEEYGNPHLLRVVTNVLRDGSLVYPTDCQVGTKLWLTIRDEDLIFRDMERMVGQMRDRVDGRKPVAVFQADCLARGRRLFNRIIKEELVHKMQHEFYTNDVPPPWLGMYGFGEFARLGGINSYHNYTTSLAAIYRL